MNNIFHLPLDKEVKANNQQTPQDIKNKKDSRKTIHIYLYGFQH